MNDLDKLTMTACHCEPFAFVIASKAKQSLFVALDKLREESRLEIATGFALATTFQVGLPRRCAPRNDNFLLALTIINLFFEFLIWRHYENERKT